MFKNVAVSLPNYSPWISIRQTIQILPTQCLPQPAIEAEELIDYSADLADQPYAERAVKMTAAGNSQE
jgi:hypothetical protein